MCLPNAKMSRVNHSGEIASLPLKELLNSVSSQLFSLILSSTLLDVVSFILLLFAGEKEELWPLVVTLSFSVAFLTSSSLIATITNSGIRTAYHIREVSGEELSHKFDIYAVIAYISYCLGTMCFGVSMLLLVWYSLAASYIRIIIISVTGFIFALTYVCCIVICVESQT